MFSTLFECLPLLNYRLTSFMIRFDIRRRHHHHLVGAAIVPYVDQRVFVNRARCTRHEADLFP